jgi:FixJ family two-component response regulator
MICLLRSLEMNMNLFAPMPDFPKSILRMSPTCRILDVRLSGQSGS